MEDIMNLSKTFALALLLLPSASWAMEMDGFEPWKENTMHAESSAATAPLAPKSKKLKPAPAIYQALLLAAAKKLGVSSKRFVPTVFMGKPISENAAAYVKCFHGSPARVFITELGLSGNFSRIRTNMLHEMAHIRDEEQKDQKERERFADTQAITNLKCFKCAQEHASWRVNLFNSLSHEGYLNSFQIIDLATKTYGIHARCPYHAELAKRCPSFLYDTVAPFMPSPLLIEPLPALVDLAVYGAAAVAAPASGGLSLFGFCAYFFHRMQREATELALEQEIVAGKLDV